MANINLGDFDISLNGENMPEFIDTRTTSKHSSWVEPFQSLSASVIQLDLPLTENPINLKKSFLKIRGKVDVDTGVNNKVYVRPFALYNIFNKAELRMGTADTLIEKYDDALPMYLMQRAVTMTDAKSLLGRRLFDEGVAIRPLDATNCGLAPATANDVAPEWGVYSEITNGDLFAADGTFEVILPLARLFETINSMETLYKGTLKTRLILTPKVTGDMGSTGGPGIGVNVGVGAMAARGQYDYKYSLTQVRWYYDEYTLEPTTAQAFNEQYQKDVDIPHRVQRCIKDTIPNGATSYSKIVQLEAAGLGAQCFMIMFRDRTGDNSRANPTKLFMPAIARLVLKLGGKTVVDITPVLKGDATNTNDHHHCLEFYEHYRQCASIFGLDESEVLPYMHWMRMFPIFAFDLTNFAPVDIKGVTPFEVTITFAAAIGIEYEMYYGLIADQIMTLDSANKAISKIVK